MRSRVVTQISFCLSLPLDFPGGTALNQRRHPPRLAPTEDMDGNAATFYNVHMSEMREYGDEKYVDVWADDVVTLSLQYSTQWDSLAHVGAEFDQVDFTRQVHGEFAVPQTSHVFLAHPTNSGTATSVRLVPVMMLSSQPPRRTAETMPSRIESGIRIASVTPASTSV